MAPFNPTANRTLASSKKQRKRVNLKISLEACTMCPYSLGTHLDPRLYSTQKASIYASAIVTIKTTHRKGYKIEVEGLGVVIHDQSS